MGRRRIYLTKDEKQKAQRRWQMEHYWRNSEQIKKKARERYRNKKAAMILKEKEKDLYGE
jgi:hypothetical protein|tara:strand:+ start:402 stop:581 length:180 start_codon:yes stop_codon:yes gene_type:complete